MNPFSTLPKMKEIDMSSVSGAKAYLSRPVEDTHSVEELAAVHRAIRYTHMFKKEESLAKMDEQELVERIIKP